MEPAHPAAARREAARSSPTTRGGRRPRADWDKVGDGFTIFPVNGLDRVRLTSVRAGRGALPRRPRFADVVAARGGHPSDVLADWVLEHDLAPGMMAESLSNNDSGKVAELVTDPTTVVGASDAGAHLQMMCGAGDSTLLLTEHVRDRGDLSLEAAVHELTGRIADRVRHPRPRSGARPGTPATSWCSRSTSSSYRPDTFVHDLPGGAPRLTRPPGGFRATVVAGAVTQRTASPPAPGRQGRDERRRRRADAVSDGRTEPLVVVSSDTHIGPLLKEQLRDYCPSRTPRRLRRVRRRAQGCGRAAGASRRFGGHPNSRTAGHHDVDARVCATWIATASPPR